MSAFFNSKVLQGALFSLQKFVECAFQATKVCSVRFFTLKVLQCAPFRLQKFCSVRFFTSKVCSLRFFRLQKFVECAFQTTKVCSVRFFHYKVCSVRFLLYFLMPHRFLQECIHSAGFHWIVTEGTCISACKYKCVYINRLCSLSVSLSLSGYPLPFLGQISHDTMIVALSLTFLTILKSQIGRAHV